MFKKIKFYIFSIILLLIGLILIFNQIISIGIAIVALAAFVFSSWEFFLKTKQKEIESLNESLRLKESERKNLEESIAEYSKRKLNLTEINSVLELGLFEVKTNFKRTYNKQFNQGEKRLWFTGTIDVEFTAKYGVDFRKLKMKIDDENQEIFLSNANPEFLAFTNRKCKWEIENIMEFHKPKLYGQPYWRTNNKLGQIINEIKELERSKVEIDSEKGPEELKWITEPLRDHVERALKLILGAHGYEIKFTELNEDDYIPLKEYMINNDLKQLGTSNNSE